TAAAGDENHSDRVRDRHRSSRCGFRRKSGAAGRKCHGVHPVRIQHEREMAGATASALGTAHRELIATVAARHKLPAVYSSRPYVSSGGLLSYGPDLIDQFRRVAGYVDRILKGEKPADLPVQAPIKYELVINLKTAKTLGLDLPASVLGRADEVIE